MALVAAVCYLGTVVVLGLPVALLSALFVPLSLATESGLRARAGGADAPEADFKRTGVGVLVGATTTAVVMFAAVLVAP